MASLVTEMVKNLPAMQDMWVQSLGQEDSLEIYICVCVCVCVYTYVEGERYRLFSKETLAIAQ